MGNGGGMICKCLDPYHSICDKDQSLQIQEWDDSNSLINSKRVNYSNSNKERNIKNKSTNNIESSIKNNIVNINDEVTNKFKKSSLFNSNTNLYICMNTNSKKPYQNL